MKKLAKEPQLQNDFKEGTKKTLRRRRDYCKRAKGPHSYILVKLNYANERYKHLSVEDYYSLMEKEERYGSHLRWWQCDVCGHSAMDSNLNPDPKIRDHVKTKQPDLANDMIA